MTIPPPGCGEASSSPPRVVRRILHVDMDAFFASVEQHDHPEHRGKPLIVAGSERSRGVVAAASYEARRFGIHSAMPTSRALRLCPQVVRVSPRHSRYHEVSAEIQAVFASYTPQVEPLSLDESFLDLTEYCVLHRCSVGPVAAEIKRAVRERTGLTASAGAGPNKLVAKIASDVEKPDGLVVVPPERVQAFLRPLPVERLWGVGPVTASRLRALGLVTIGDIANRDPAWLEQTFGRSGPIFHQLARGDDDRPVVTWHEPRSVSSENTFATDVADADEVLNCLREQAEEVASRLRSHGYHGRTVNLKLRYADFTTITRSLTPPHLVADVGPLFAIARTLLLTRTEFPQRPIRLVGVGVSGLLDAEGPVQLELWDDLDGEIFPLPASALRVPQGAERPSEESPPPTHG